MLENLHKESFEAQLHTLFQLPEITPSTMLELVDVSGPGIQGQQESFVLTFLGPIEAFLGQGTLRLQHDQLGTLDLFMVPTGQTSNGIEYEAVFNRFVEDTGNEE